VISCFALSVSTPFTTQGETLKKGIVAAIQKTLRASDVEIELLHIEREPDDDIPPPYVDEA
jgi:hypothetical protein